MMEDGPAAVGTPLLTVRKLGKSFGPNVILKDIAFDLARGQIHALVGENGCGKSTFIKCLAGYHDAASGSEILVRGQPLPASYGAEQALALGFRFIHQNLGLVPTLSVLENLALSNGYVRSGLGIDWAAQRARTRRALEAAGASVDPEAKISSLSVADRTLVALARCLQDADGSVNHENILVLDEPTAALPEMEVDHLFKALRAVAARGAGIIYVSHRLNEILDIADTVTAFRDGRRVATRPTAGMTERDLVQMIIGRSLDAYFPEPAHTAAREVILSAERISGPRLRDVSLDVHRGEVVGIAGLLGSGRSELARILFGAQKRTAGRIRMEGEEIRLDSPADGLGRGIGYVPQDRIGRGGIPTMTLAQNLTLPSVRKFWRPRGLDRRRERELTLSVIERYSVRPPDPDALLGRLSGGNQQKIIIARGALADPKLYILDEPVQGVDIGSKTEIFGIIRRLAEGGTGVVVIDSNFEDLAHLCDRVVVLRNGRVSGTVMGADRTAARISELAFTSGAA